MADVIRWRPHRSAHAAIARFTAGLSPIGLANAYLDARYQDGVLELVLPKKAGTAAKQLAVK